MSLETDVQQLQASTNEVLAAVQEVLSGAATNTAANVTYSDSTIYTTGSIGYVLRQLKSRTVDLVDDLGFSPTGLSATAAQNNAAIDAWITHAAANPGTTYTAKRGHVFYITATNKTIPACNIQFNGARFLWSGNISGGASNVFSFSAGTSADAIRLHIVSGSNWRRLMTVNGQSDYGLIEIAAESQGGVYGNNFDSALYTLGGDLHIDRVKIVNCFIPAQFRGTPGGASAENVYIGDLDVKTYCKGPLFNNITGLRLKGGWVRGSGTGKLSDPGFNALLLGALRDARVSGLTLEDSGEHGLRLGGWGTGEQTNKGIVFSDIRVKNSGQCGFKIYTGVDDGTLWQEDITMSNIDVVNPRARSGAGGWNDVGFLIQQVKNFRAQGLSCFVDAGNPYCGMWISQADNAQVNGYTYNQVGGLAAARALVISEGNGPADIYPDRPTYPINNVSVRNMHATGHSAQAVHIDIPIDDARGIEIQVRAFGGTDVVHFGGASSRAVQKCVFTAGGQNFSGNLFNVPGSANLITRNLFSAIA